MKSHRAILAILTTLLATHSTFVHALNDEEIIDEHDIAVEAEDEDYDEGPPLQVNVTAGPDCSENPIVDGNYVTVDYTGWIDESSLTGVKGYMFESSHDEGRYPMNFTIGKYEVLRGWEEGLLGKCVGSQVTLIMPPAYAWGDEGDTSGDIPGNATLRFDVNITKVAPKAPPTPNLFAMIDTNGDGEITEEESDAFFVKRGYEETPEDMFDNEDRDGDGVISWREFTGPKGDKPPSKKKNRRKVKVKRKKKKNGSSEDVDPQALMAEAMMGVPHMAEAAQVKKEEVENLMAEAMRAGRSGMNTEL